MKGKMKLAATAAGALLTLTTQTADASTWQTLAPNGYRLIVPGIKAPATPMQVTFDSSAHEQLLSDFFSNPVWSVNHQNGISILNVGGTFNDQTSTIGQVQVHLWNKPCKPTATYGIYTLTSNGDGEAFTSCTWTATGTDGSIYAASIYLNTDSFPTGAGWTISRANLVGHELFRAMGLTHVNDVPNDCPHQDDASETPVMCEPLGGYQGYWGGYATPDDALGLCVLAQYAGRTCAGWSPYYTDTSVRKLTGLKRKK
jgi:hypothetical protein